MYETDKQETENKDTSTDKKKQIIKIQLLIRKETEHKDTTTEKLEVEDKDTATDPKRSRR